VAVTPEKANPWARALVLTGPTGAGKTAVSLDLAERLNAEIVAMDSMTLYRGMDIGTAKPTPAERERVPHHMIDVLDVHESANVAWWLERAAAACDDIRARGKRPLFVGGTPFYLKAMLHGIFEGPPIDTGLRRELEREANALGPVAFHAKLAAVDPAAAAKIHANNIRRVVRALEVHTATGIPMSELQCAASWDAPPRKMAAVMLDWPRNVLAARINTRVDAMLAAGWLEECRTLLGRGFSKEARQAVGYSLLMDALRSPSSSLESIAELIRQQTRQFAKRQLTWFRKLPLTSIDASTPHLAERIAAAWEAASIPDKT
jgi:tRNA dimethylallyltransferase